MENENQGDSLKELTQIVLNLKEQLEKVLQQHHETPQYYFSADVKRRLKISDSSLRRLRAKKQIPYTTIGGTYIYPAAFINVYIMNKMKNEFNHLFD
jgi:hypothetical protein